LKTLPLWGIPEWTIVTQSVVVKWAYPRALAMVEELEKLAAMATAEGLSPSPASIAFLCLLPVRRAKYGSLTNLLVK
jgi:hypothetical protein